VQKNGINDKHREIENIFNEACRELKGGLKQLTRK